MLSDSRRRSYTAPAADCKFMRRCVLKTTLVLASLALLLLGMGDASAQTIRWTNGTGNNLWGVSDNWSCYCLPSIYDTTYVQIDKASPDEPVIVDGEDAQAFQIRFGRAANCALLTMDGGTLTTAEWMMVGTDANGLDGRFNLNGGAVTIGSLNPSNGHLTIGYCSLGILVMNGGTISVAGKLRLGYWVGGNAYVYLNGGTITTADFSMNEYGSGSAALMDFSGGTLIISGDKTALINTYINNGWITANSGSGMVKVDYDQTNPGMTTVTADTTVAIGPQPVNNVVNVDPCSTTLTWTCGSGAVSHNIYFGTDFQSVSTANRLAGDLDGNGQVDLVDLGILCSWWLQDPTCLNPPKGVNDDNNVDSSDFALLASNWMARAGSAYKGNSGSAASYNPGIMTMGTAYYWRIDEVNGPAVHKGKVWNFKTASAYTRTLYGKVMCGYQGWFDTPTDGAGRGWVHWTKDPNAHFYPGLPQTGCGVDMWPDMNDMTAGEKYAAVSDGALPFKLSNGATAYVYSGQNATTVSRHFQWMTTYGIDGVFLQRFGTDLRDYLGRQHCDTVLSQVKTAANAYGRVYAVMYDLSNLNLGEIDSLIKSDWRSLVGSGAVNNPADGAYIYHKGKPVVAVWGIGWSGRNYTTAECGSLIDFLKNDPVYGGFTVMIGVPSSWRTSRISKDPDLAGVIAKADIVSPWTVGGMKMTSPTGWSPVDDYYNNTVPSDITWCNQHNIEYMPVVYPGFSFHNSDGSNINKVPRWGGNFLWRQYYKAIDTAGISMIYQAMFDEVDEGTAIFKVTNSMSATEAGASPAPYYTVSTGPLFVIYREDTAPNIVPNGAKLPTDHYLWLVGQGGRMLRGEIPLSQDKPTR
jgi:hypothetical protein